MNLIDKIDETHKRVLELKQRLQQAKQANNTKDIELFEKRVSDIARDRYALRSLYVETVCAFTGISLEDIIQQTGSHLDITQLRDQYSVTLLIETKP